MNNQFKHLYNLIFRKLIMNKKLTSSEKEYLMIIVNELLDRPDSEIFREPVDYVAL